MKYFTLIIVSVLIIGGSCNKLVEIQPPKDKVTDANIFSSSELLNAAVLNSYRSLDFESNFSPFNGVYTDEFISGFPLSGDVPPYVGSALKSNDIRVSNTWKALYGVIYRSNFLLEGMDHAVDITDSVKNRVTGEAKLLRAYCYFYLINIWGDVPLLLTTDVNVTAIAERKNVSVVYDQILADLKDAQLLLKSSYLNEEKVRATKWAATALLARVYLFLHDWPNAEAQATAIINCGLFTPLPSLSSAFKKENKEAIFELWTQNGFTSLGPIYVPGTATTKPTYIISNSLFNSFEINDGRKTAWISNNVVSGQAYYYPAKYKVFATTSGAASEYLILLRAAEQYLIRAEAAAMQNNLPAAIADLNVVRVRAGLPGLPVTLNQAQVLAAVEQEGRSELFAEEGHRFFDLKRLGKIDAVMSALKTTWKPTASLYPIPLSDISTDPNLAQNPGY